MAVTSDFWVLGILSHWLLRLLIGLSSWAIRPVSGAYWVLHRVTTDGCSSFVFVV